VAQKSLTQENICGVNHSAREEQISDLMNEIERFSSRLILKSLIWWPRLAAG
jgi:Ni,Fe-hydrogenase III large subunit